MDKPPADEVALQAIEQIIASLDSMAETQRNMCDIAQELLKEFQRANREAKKSPRRGSD